jgi:long-chain acyl-CoA synthetase
LVFPWTGVRWTYADLKDEAERLARGLLAMGIHKGDRISVMAGNCEQYISVFFAAARVGAILVVLNNTYTPSELYYALNHSGRTRPVHREAVAMLTRTQNADCSL